MNNQFGHFIIQIPRARTRLSSKDFLIEFHKKASWFNFVFTDEEVLVDEQQNSHEKQIYLLLDDW